MNYQMLSQALGEQMGPGTQAGAQVRAPWPAMPTFVAPPVEAAADRWPISSQM